jgi:phage gp29-like protein
MQMKKFLQQVGRNGYGLFPQGMEVQLMHASNTGQVTTYSDFLEYGHKEYSILLLGQAGTTGEGEGGAYAQSVVLNGIRQDIISNVGKMSSKGYQHLIDKGLRLNYGEDYKPHLLPDVKPILLNSTDAREKARAAQIVSTKMGVAVPERHVYEHILGVEKPKEGEMTVMHGERFEFGVDEEPKPKMNQQGLGSNAPADSAEAPEDTERSGNENESQDQGRSSQA